MKIVQPLTNLIKKNIKFKWIPKYKQAFNNLKYHFITALILTYFNSNFKYIVKTDSSNYILGGVLLQYMVTSSWFHSCLLIVHREVELKGFLSSLSSRDCLTWLLLQILLACTDIYLSSIRYSLLFLLYYDSTPPSI